MRIDKLSLRNFRSYQAADVDLAPGLNIVGGLNGAGKSTLLDALAVGLTGTCRGAEGGRGLDDLRRIDGTRKAKWGVQIQAGGETFTRQEGEGPRAAVQQRIEAVLGVPGSVIRACLYSGELLRLERKEAQRLILDLAKPAAIDLPAEIRELCSGLKMMPPEASVTLSDLERLYRDAYAKRTDAGRALKAIGVVPPPEPPAGLEGMTLAAMDDQRRVIGTKIADLERQRDQAVRAQAEAASGPARLRDRIAAGEQQLTGLREKLAKLPTNDNAQMRALSLSHQLTAAEEGRTGAATVHRDAQQRVANAEARLEQASTEVSAAEATPENCPTCGAKTTATARKKALEISRDRAKAAEAEAHAARHQLAEAASVLQATPDAAAIQRQLVDLEQQEALRGTLAEQIAAIEAQLSSDTAAAMKLEASPAPVDVDALATRITEGRRRLDMLTGHAAAVRAYEQTTAGQAKAEVERDKLDRLCELLGPDGLRKDLAGGGGVQDFQAAVNVHLDGMGFKVDLGPLLALEDDATVNGLPTRLLSSSEQIRFGLAFQVAVASACGFGLVVVDDFERLDPGSRGAAMGVLTGCGHQVLVLATITKTPEEFIARAEAGNAGGGARYLYVSRDAEGRSCVGAPGLAQQVAA